ncbi:MAG: MFS transporter, partial [Solirubrobacterales bacterium]|nr:MFS transporter [Solirubrobacterales bacterium]
MRTRPSWVLAVASVASLMVALDALVVTTALPTIRTHLGASIEQLEWTVNAYTLSFAVLLMTGAALGDRFGRRRMFAAGLAIFAGASAACGLAPNVGLLIAARTVQGAGAALVMPLGLTLLSAAYAPEHRARALGIFSGVTGLAVLGGPVIGGAITQGIAWQWIFWINVPIGLLTIPVLFRRVEESYGPRSAPDIAGLALVTG